MLAGCGSTDGTTGSGDASQDTSAAASSLETAGVPEEPVKIIMQRPLWNNSDPSAAPYVRIREKIKERINVDVEIVGQQNPADQYEKPNLMLAAGEPLDIFQTPYGAPKDWRRYSQEDSIIPLNELLEKYGQDLLKNIDQGALKACTDADGKIWALPDEMNPVTTVLMMRQDWLDKEGLQVPETFEEYESVLKVFKDTYKSEGFVPFWPGAEENCFLGSFIATGDQNYKDTDGKIKPYYMNSAYKDFLAKMADWYKKGFLHKEFATMQYQQATEIAFGGRSGLFTNWISGTFKDNIDMLAKNVPDGQLVIAAPPKGPAGRMITKGLPITSCIYITKSCKNPEAAMKFLNWSMGTDEGWLLTKYGEEGMDYNWVDKEKHIIDYTDKKADVERMGYAIFASCRLNTFVNKYSVGSTINNDATLFLHDNSKYPSAYSIDINVIYDTSKMNSRDLITSLDTMRLEERAKIIMGTKPVSDWDNFITNWLKTGGDKYIDDLTQQFNAQQK